MEEHKIQVSDAIANVQERLKELESQKTKLDKSPNWYISYHNELIELNQLVLQNLVKYGRLEFIRFKQVSDYKTLGEKRNKFVRGRYKPV